MKRSVCFDLQQCMYPASVYLLLKGKARVVCGVWPPVNLLPTASFVVDGKAAASPFPRDMWRAAAEGEWDRHHPAALEEADAGVYVGGKGQVGRRNFRNAPLMAGWDSSQVFYIRNCPQAGSVLSCCATRHASSGWHHNRVGNGVFHFQLL